jgi:hypothetical protein
MGDVLVAILVLLLVVGATALTTGWLLLRKARRSLRVGRRPVGNRPPLVWLVSPKPLPRLHHRVRRTVILVRDTYPAPPRRRRAAPRHPYADYADRLEAVAAALGAELVHASYLPKAPRQEAGRWLTAQVRDLELAATTLCRAVSVPGASSADATAALHRDVARLEAAQRELDELFPPVVFDHPGRVAAPPPAADPALPAGDAWTAPPVGRPRREPSRLRR